LCALLSYCILCWNYSQAQSIRKIFINPKNPVVQKQSNFVDSIRFIPFEQIESVNLANGAVRPTKKYYLVTDYGSRILYIFSKTGALVKKISFKELGGNLYPVYQMHTDQLIFFGDNSKYSLTPKDRIKILLDWSNERNLKYFRKFVIDLEDTTFAIVKSRADKFDLMGAEPLLTGHYIQTRISTSPLYPDSIGNELNLYAHNQLLKTYFPYNRINEPRYLFNEERITHSLSDTPSVSYLARPYCDTIYKLAGDSLYAAYQLVLPLENSLPATFFSKPFKDKTERENFTRNNGWVFYQAHNFYETRRYIYTGIRFFMRHDAYIYDKQTNATYSVSKIKPDPQQYNLSLFLPFIQRSGNKFYKLVDGTELVFFFKQNPDVVIPQELSVFLQSGPAKNTPVLVEYTLKD
jgi:hypothetical protein